LLPHGELNKGKKVDHPMKMHVQRLVGIEKRPLCFCDFLDSGLSGSRYIMTHGTFKYKISTLSREFGTIRVLFRLCRLS
jgi:hypothetical protein